MVRLELVARAVLVLGAFALLGPGCASGEETPRRDGGGAMDGAMDGGRGESDAQTGDADTDGGPDDPDSGPPVIGGTCATCATNDECEVGSYCAMLVSGGRACLPGCVPDLPLCPRMFSCIFDATGTGVDATICAPVGGPCCVDEDGDGYGSGVGCMGEDCDDSDPEVHPDRTEICDGVDTNCNRTVDEPPTDCDTGVCTLEDDGTYESLASGVCTAGACTSGTITECGLFTCSGGGETGALCATTCAPAGTDDDAYCVETAHCDAGACVDDSPNGGMCDEDSDCSATHCDNGFCCGSGTCCAASADCPGYPGAGTLCVTPTDCEGTRGSITCDATTFACVIEAGVADDSACDATVVADECGLFADLSCDGAASQPRPRCPSTCTRDDQCDGAAHCDLSTCFPDLPDGNVCDEASDCGSGYCNNGFCCSGGDCCRNAADCPSSYTTAPTCDDARGCQGTRDSATCVANVCTTMADIPDDTQCNTTVQSDTCGLYPTVRCTGGAAQTAPMCPSSCTGDSECDENAHCDAGVCTLDLPNGDACDETSDCTSGNCTNRFCCGSGTCCTTNTDCPGYPGAGTVCSTPEDCQGTRGTIQCNVAIFACETISGVADDTACTSSVVADTCGFYTDLSCNGAADQPRPRCPTSCTSDAQCDANAHCDLGACFPDLPSGDACDEASDCTGGHCMNGFCCASGDCCRVPTDCPASYGTAAVCDDTRGCQGSRSAPSCVANSCGTTTGVGDDSACTTGTVADLCGLFPTVRCTGATAQTAPSCAMSCAEDTDCDANAHCDASSCVIDVPSGAPCDEASDCIGGYCGNGFCCAAGDCCAASADCPGYPGVAPVCSSPAICQGTRTNISCNVALNQCVTAAGVGDDSMCTMSIVASNCGFFADIACNGAVDQPIPSCATSCTLDSACDSNAHCDGGTCVLDIGGGSACDEASDCSSGYCANGYCCASGDCCSVAANCPATYRSAPACETASTCQGTRDDATCVASQCGTAANVPDDSACTAGVVANTCGIYPSVSCNGAATQSMPPCPAACTTDSDCDANAHCDASACVLDVPNGSACDEASDCTAGYCGNGYCCSSGSCCNVASNCPSSFSSAPTCNTPATCQGTRTDATCSATTFQCGTTAVIADDTACSASTIANTCGEYPAVSCTGAASQSAPMCAASCTMSSQCDSSAYCNAGMCVPNGTVGVACAGPGTCTAGLTCVDGVCCTSSCGGGCQACNLPGSLGTCTSIPNGADPANECAGFSCDAYYSGFSGDVCRDRADASAAQVSCNGAGACQAPAVVCPAQAAGDVRLTCDAACQNPTVGTCQSTVAPLCTNVNPGTQTCGSGPCQVTVNQCSGGAALTCTPNTALMSSEVCDNIDNDCDGPIDDFPAVSSCSATNAAAYSCSAGTCGITGCAADYFNRDGVYSNGCECRQDAVGNQCGAASDLGSVGVGATLPVVTGNLAGAGDADEDWYRVTFAVAPICTRRPRVTLSAGSEPVRMQVFTSCSSSTPGGGFGCAEGGNSTANLTSWEQTNSATCAEASSIDPTPAVGSYVTTSTTIWIRVLRSGTTTSCFPYSLTVAN